ncbi:DUF4190 domain-containing protein [Paenibacillus nasutitermitis]|uniref:DUF4190 domain-containing protein n=1 Tax=Paenibacillus nasutitermitis TaxID=1652958 RepID=A0A916Z2C8_9BACL|nr:DUF4190 domain-containing protein [Paenibacillus nasutitermitis]GGD71262.1 hypothetical protein GCM10010911_31460 [Paenibacillus nasutitermitis]
MDQRTEHEPKDAGQNPHSDGTDHRPYNEEVSAELALPISRKERVENETKADHHPYNEEMSAELAAPVGRLERTENQTKVHQAVEETTEAGRAAGWAALVLSLLSWFVWPLLLGATGAVVGFIAYRQGAKSLGLWSMVLGLISFLAYLVIIPIYFMVTR